MPRFTKEHLFHIRPVASLVEETHETGHELKRAVGPVSLTALGVGATIGAGIFATTGTAIVGDPLRPGAGPAIVVAATHASSSGP